MSLLCDENCVIDIVTENQLCAFIIAVVLSTSSGVSVRRGERGGEKRIDEGGAFGEEIG